MKKKFLIGTVCIFMLQACGNDEILPLGSGQDSRINFENNKQKFDQALGDPSGTDFRLNSAEILEDQLAVEVSYSGGCKEHNFEFIWNDLSQIGSMKIVELVLVHDGKDDACEAYITETLEIPFQDIPNIHQHLTTEKTIRIYNASNEERIVVYQGLPSFKEGQNCELLITAEDVVCGDGVFKNTWFRYATTSNEGPAYLQPAHIGILGTFLPDLDEGDYMVGVELSEPFVPDPDNAICLAYPGPSIPVTIYCLEEL